VCNAAGLALRRTGLHIEVLDRIAADYAAVGVHNYDDGTIFIGELLDQLVDHLTVSD
jgi:hypothetical protein